ncbi:MAG: CpaF family protein [Candidatus Desulforudis sp.]|nr:CpaF family protein [Desulforudis sp.]
MEADLNKNLEQLADHYRERLLREENLDRLTALPRAELQQTLSKLVQSMLAEEKQILTRLDRENLLALILNESVGYGPLEPLLNDATVSEIMVNGAEEVYAERQGRLELTDVRFRDQAHVRHIISRIIAPIGRRIDESSPMVDARLPDGSRVNAVIPPVSLSGPVLTIRKFFRERLTLDDLIHFGSLSEAMAEFVQATVKAKVNILISGGTGSGKTTTLNILSSFIPEGERIITIEDMAELNLGRRHVLGLEARPANVEGRGEIPIRQLVRNALRMRPDRIIVGEVRGDEALDMLQAMNTGHEGSLTTVHANTPEDAFARLEAMVLMAGANLSVQVIREHIASAIHLVLQTERLSDGSRKVMSIAEVHGFREGRTQVVDLFRFQRHGMRGDGRVAGGFHPTGTVPALLERMKVFGVAVPESLFLQGVPGVPGVPGAQGADGEKATPPVDRGAQAAGGRWG